MTAVQEIVGVPDEFYGAVKARFKGKRAAFAAVPMGETFRVAIAQQGASDVELIPSEFGEFPDGTKAWRQAEKLNLYALGLNSRKASRILAPIAINQPSLFGFNPAKPS